MGGSAAAGTLGDGLQRVVNAFQNIPLGITRAVIDLHRRVNKTIAVVDEVLGSGGALAAAPLVASAMVATAAVTAAGIGATPKLPAKIAAHKIHRLFRCRYSRLISFYAKEGRLTQSGGTGIIEK